MEVVPSGSNSIVIIGGGFAGLWTALSLSSHVQSPPVVLIEPRSRFVFLPLLYELLSNEIKAWEIAPPYRRLIAGRGIAFIQDSIQKIDIAKKHVFTSSGNIIHYAQLIVCTGSKPKLLGIPGVIDYASTFNQLEDVAKLNKIVVNLKTNITRDNNLIIVGAGPSGVELACKTADLLNGTAQIHLIELGDRVLPDGKSFNQEQALLALNKRNIKLYMNTRLLRVNSETVELARNAENINLKYKALIWTAGTEPSCPLGIPEQMLNHGRICIDSNFKVAGLNDVFAIGDVSIDINNPTPATAQGAMQQANFLAKNLLAIRKGNSLESFEFIDRGEMLSLGIGEATITGSGLTLSGSIAFKLRRLIYLSKMPNMSLGIRSASAWLIENQKNFN